MKSWVGTGEGKARKSVLCGNECKRVSHTLWDCRSIRAPKLQAGLGGSYARFEAMRSLDKSSFVLGNELWEEHFESLLALVKGSTRYARRYASIVNNRLKRIS